MINQLRCERENGIFYTPEELADFVASLAIKQVDSELLDPCYGEGALLLAAHKRLVILGCKNPKKQLFGYDITPPKKENSENNLHRLVRKKNLRTRDLFLPNERESKEKYDVVLMNPPFVRHHLIPREVKKNIRDIIGNDWSIPLSSDLWAYFLVHSLNFIRKGGTLAAILPWSFLYADFARRIRELLLERFQTLRVLVIGKRMFARAEERILVVLGNGFGSSSFDISICYSHNVSKKRIAWTYMDGTTWLESPRRCLASVEVHSVLEILKNRLGLKPLREYARVHIGTVTGANKFFILDKDLIKAMRLPHEILQPIITRSNYLRNLTIYLSDEISDRILLIPKDMRLPKQLKEYIKTGEKHSVNNGYHTRNRPKWYSIPVPKPPDGFLHYMTKEIPFIVLNPQGILSTNTVHQVDFKNRIDEKTKKWIQFSMLTSICQVSIELLARTYGGGILKIEPTAAGKILVYAGNGGQFPTYLEKKLNDFLLKGNRREAMKFADNWIIENQWIPKKDIETIKKCYWQMRDLRLGIDGEFGTSLNN